VDRSPKEPYLPRVRWKENPNAVELGFDFYLELLERRLKGERVSLVQSLRQYYREELGIDLRENQARGLMHKSSSVFIDYVNDVAGADFTPGIQFWEKQGIGEFLRWREAFYKARAQEAADTDEELMEMLEKRAGRLAEPPQTQRVIVNRIIRDSALGRFLKSLYSYRCQICKSTFRLPSGSKYVESHHLRPLGRRHGGIDKETNMLILCPNHHAMMDYGAIAIHPDQLTVLSIDKNSRESNKPVQLMRHPIDKVFLEYHLANIFNKVA